MKRFWTIAILLALAVAWAVPASPAAAAGARSYLIIATSANGLPAGLEARISQAGGTLTRSLPQVGIAVAESSQPDFKTNAARIGGVRAVVPNSVRQWLEPVENVEEAFSDPPFSGDDDFFFDLQWGHTAVQAADAWNEGYRGAGVRVAVLDSGIDADNPDLAPNLNTALSASFVPGEGYNVRPGNYFSHGTHVAGTIAAADNAWGVIGVAPEAEIVAVKVLSEFTGSGSWESVIAGIVYAAEIDADVINMSFGATLVRSGYLDDNGTSDTADDVWVTASEVADQANALGRATSYAYQQGSTLIAAAGNAGIDRDHDANVLVVPPDSPHVIQISATAPIGWAKDPLNTFLDNLASYSNYGQSRIDFAAPGGDAAYPGNENCTVAGLIRPCWVFDLVFSNATGNPGGSYSFTWAGGTSMAAPHASAVAALIIGKNGGSMAPAQVESELRASADDLGKPGNDDVYGAGRVNAYNAVR